MTTPISDSTSRTERILAYLVAGVVALSILAFVAMLIGTASGVGDNDGFSQGVWPFVITFPLFGLPAGFILLISLLVINGVRRSREAKANRP